VQCRQPVAQFQISVAEGEWAIQVENDDAFAFPLFGLETGLSQPQMRRRDLIMIFAAISSV